MLKGTFYLFLSSILSISLNVNANEGSSRMSIGGGSLPEWTYSIEGDNVTGSIWGFSAASGRVNLTKGEDGWEGRIGTRTVDVKSIETKTEDDGDIVTRIVFRVFPGSTYSYKIKQELEDDENGEYEITGISSGSLDGRGQRLRGYQDDERLHGESGYLEFRLNEDDDMPGRYDGHASVFGPNRFPQNTYSMNLVTAGRLNPKQLMEEDKALYLILYHLPFSMTSR